ncbi:Transcriptional regulator [Enhygromyxa salina]|uniref:Transcriptional regulator n=1 Tax=Enhygromyxa salina TaxID=215803 RepID=A0A0C2CXS2_9BACT|nr:HEXXH motif domain-containing protein [Enhygromyxa salina]KIG14440.1 Transcriptional regulator [Enhygromyxa salina]
MTSSTPKLAPRDLTIPEPGSTTARDALSGSIRKAMQDLMRLTAAPDPELRAFKPTLKRLLSESPGAVASVLRSPTVSGLLRCLRRRAPELDFSAGVAELLATIHTDLALAGALSQPVSQRRLPARIVSLPARRVVTIPPQIERAEFRNHELVLIGPAGRTTIALEQAASDEAAFVKITDQLSLACVDNNPLAMSEAHPDKAGNSLDLGGRPAKAWADTLASALDLIGRYMPALRGEIDLYLHQIVPVGYDEHTHLSASYQEVIGTVYMTLHPQLMTMVEATIHEFQHNKLHAQLELDPLLHNAFHPLYGSPVRPDPRPLQGVLLAVHAFVPVARLYQLMREAGHEGTGRPDFERRYAQIIKGNHEGASVLLEHGQPTEIGRGLLDELRRWDAHPW